MPKDRTAPHWTTIAEAYLTGYRDAGARTPMKTKLCEHLRREGYVIMPPFGTPAARARGFDADEETVIDFVGEWWKEKSR